MKKILAVNLIFIFCLSLLKSQTSVEVLHKQDSLGLYPSKYGVYINGNLNFHSSSGLMEIDPIALGADPKFTEGSGFSFGGGLFYDYPFSKDISMIIRLGYNLYSGEFKGNGILPASQVYNINGKDTILKIDANQEFYIASNIPVIDAELLFSYNNLFNKGINFHLGPKFGLPLSPTFNQDRYLTDTSLTTFLDRTFKQEDVEISNAKFFISANIGLSWDIPIMRNYFLSPEIFYSFPITAFYDEKNKSDKTSPDWKISSLKAGISIKSQGERPCPPGMYRDETGNCVWEPCPPGQVRGDDGLCNCRPGMFVNQKGECEWPPCPDRNYKRDENGDCKQILFAQVKAEPILPSGLPAENDQLTMKESQSLISQPLLNYIFFNEGQGDIPSRYQQFPNDDPIGSFNEKKVADPGNPLKTYYNILNILGYRLSNNPFAKITLVAYNMSGSESNSTDIPQKRTDTVANYLMKIWKVPDYRIDKKVYNLPPEIKDENNKSLLDEYRRVEIVPDTAHLDIFKPVEITEMVYKAFPPKINFNFDVIPMTTVDSWKFITYQKDLVFYENSGNGKPPEILTWYPNTQSRTFDVNKGNINYTLEIADKNKAKVKTENSLPSSWVPYKPDVKLTEYDSTYAMYYLLFNFNDKFIDRDIRKNTDILNNIKFNEYKSKFKMTGFTDKIGDLRSNKILSNERVDAVAKYMVESRNLNDAYLDKQGLGYVELYDNQLPEGRLYNRTVAIEVSTPYEEGEKEKIKLTGCYIIVYSDENKQNAQSVFDILAQRGVKDIIIEKYYEASVDKTYWRVQSRMYKDVQEAVQARAKISIYTKQMNLEKPPTLKCEK